MFGRIFFVTELTIGCMLLCTRSFQAVLACVSKLMKYSLCLLLHLSNACILWMVLIYRPPVLYQEASCYAVIRSHEDPSDARMLSVLHANAFGNIRVRVPKLKRHLGPRIEVR